MLNSPTPSIPSILCSDIQLHCSALERNIINQTFLAAQQINSNFPNFNPQCNVISNDTSTLLQTSLGF